MWRPAALGKAGMRREAEFIKDRRWRQWVNTVAFALLREEFKAGQ